MSQSEASSTTDHDRIREWADSHDAVPVTVRDTKEDGAPGVLTLDVVGYGADEEELEHIDWDTWFAKFDENELAFLYQDEKKGRRGVDLLQAGLPRLHRGLSS